MNKETILSKNEEFVKIFPTTRNKDLAIKFNCSIPTILRAARLLDINKDPNHMSNMLTLSQKVVIDNYNEVHDFKYDYSRVKYTGGHNDVEIGCPIHGWFCQNAKIHGEGAGFNFKCVMGDSGVFKGHL